MTLETAERSFAVSAESISDVLCPAEILSVNILLVDDDPRNLDVLASILDMPGYCLVRAQNADDALRALMVQDFALLVLDVRMPDMSGLELAQLIKQRKKTRNLPIIFLTAYYREDEHVIQGYTAGAVDYLSKPCNPDVLRSKVAVFVDLFRANQALQEEIHERQQAEKRVAERTAEVQHLVLQLRALAADLTQAEQQERKRLAKILHDHIQQLLVSAQMQIATIKREPLGIEVQSNLQDIDFVLREALNASRSLTVELSPPILQDAGLAAGLKWLVNRMAEKNQFRVTLDIQDRAEPGTEEIRFLLFECARELLFNAVKHAGVSEARVTLLRAHDGRVRMIVEDRGNGFDLDLHEGRKAEHPTFGLFSIQQRLMHLGGSLEIDAAPGKGVRITLTAPLETISENETEPEDPGPSPRRSAQHQNRRRDKIGVLIVDDHKIMRQGLAGLLQCEGDFDIIGEAEDGPQAIEMAERLQPEVIIMDVNLGEMSGLQATRIILNKNSATRIIGLSMHNERHVEAAMRDAGAVAYLTKGGASQDLIATIRACVK